MRKVLGGLSAVRGLRFAVRKMWWLSEVEATVGSSAPKMMLALLLTMVYGLWSMDLQAKELPAKSSTLVNDYAGVLRGDQRAALEQKLVAYYDSTSTQIAVVIENSLEDDDLFDYSQRLATAWGIGEQGKNNGVQIYL